MKQVKIHHATVKLAAKLGLTLRDAGDVVEIIDKNGKVVASGATGREALAQVLNSETTRQTMARLRGANKPHKARRSRANDEDVDDEDEDAEDDEGKSVVKRKYKVKYRPHRMTCGDPLSKQLRSEFMTVRDPDTKKLKVDWTRFTQFAKINGCWSDDYRKLNKGMRRMNVVNRLRALIKDGHKVVWSV